MEISDAGSPLREAAVRRNFAIISADACSYKMKYLRRNLLLLRRTRKIEQNIGAT